MIGLHVVDKDIVQLASMEGLLQIFKELGLNGPIHRVKEDGFLIQKEIGVIGHPSGNGVGGLELGSLPIISANPQQVICHFADTVHIWTSLSKRRFLPPLSYHIFFEKDSRNSSFLLEAFDFGKVH